MKRLTKTGSTILPGPVGILGTALLALLLGACQAQQPGPSEGHLTRATPPPPRAMVHGGPGAMGQAPHQRAFPSQTTDEVYTLKVTDMPVKDLLFALARDAEMNVDIYPGISGRITLTAIDQTIDQILDRIARQIDLRYEIQGNSIIISPDRPYLHIYQVDYVNMMRSSASKINISSQLASMDESGAQEGEKNQSTLAVANMGQNQFWTTLTNNIRAILKEGSQSIETGPGGEPVSLVDLASGGIGAEGGGDIDGLDTGSEGLEGPGILAVNPETGLVSIFGTARQHARIKKLLDTILDSAHRQVLIESTVIEVELSDRHQEGVNWTQVREDLSGFNIAGDLVTGSITEATTFFAMGIAKAGKEGAMNATLNLLRRYGNTKVLSSPKIMALNNQPAVLKVVDNRVYFTIDAKSDTTSGGSVVQTYSSKAHTVPIGLVMSVTPQISKNDQVSLLVRPTLTSILSWKNDPNPALKTSTVSGLSTDVISQIPEIRVRELESMLRINSGQTAVMGGLMQDQLNKSNTSVPGLSNLPLVGNLFRYKDDQVIKTELVIFLRPVVMTSGRPKPDMFIQKTAAHAQGGSAKTAWGTYTEESNPNLDFTRAGSPRIPVIAPTVHRGRQAPSPPAGAPGGPTLNFTDTRPAAPPADLADPYENQSEGGDDGLATISVMQPNGAAQPPPAAAPAPPPPAPAGQDLSMTYVNPPTVVPTAPPAPVVTPAPEAAAPSKGFFVDLGSYLSPENADTTYNKVAQLDVPVYLERSRIEDQTYLRVRSGPFNTQGDAESARSTIQESAGIQGQVAAY